MRLGIFVGLFLTVALGVGAVVSPFASTRPDGLERVAEDHGFADRGAPHALQESSPAPGYAFPGIEGERAATAVAGLVGTAGIFLAGAGLARLLRRRDAIPG